MFNGGHFPAQHFNPGHFPRVTVYEKVVYGDGGKDEYLDDENDILIIMSSFMELIRGRK